MDEGEGRDDRVCGLRDPGRPTDGAWYGCFTRGGEPVGPRRGPGGAEDSLLTACDDLRLAGPGHEVRRSDGIVLKATQGPRDYAGWMSKIARRNAAIRESATHQS